MAVDILKLKLRVTLFVVPVVLRPGAFEGESSPFLKLPRTEMGTPFRLFLIELDSLIIGESFLSFSSFSSFSSFLMSSWSTVFCFVSFWSKTFGSKSENFISMCSKTFASKSFVFECFSAAMR
jgi:hypothetical protein